MQHLIFDIDGTLWDTTGVVAVAWNDAIRASGVSEIKDLIVTADMLKREFGKPMDEIADDLFGPIDSDKKARLLEHCCELEHDAILNNNDDLSYEGMRDTMRMLSENNDLYIVSNCQDGYIELVIEKNGLSKYIKDFECFGHTGLYKADNIKLLMERNGIEKAVYIGDTYGDYLATKEAGCEFCFAKYGFGQVEKPDYVIETFADLRNLW